ncbi:MAG: 2,3-bisphosphoglycerate-dependent phosphoglycerate mutase, partial [Olsenella sp.]|nr:2,3-bisphosphoglycerate-dependent phosphoglycerate mutase [Olsenella sp.]
MAQSRLIIMRHGESAWTDPSVNRFAGWVDVPLTERGRAQAKEAGVLMKEAGIAPDAVFTSLLSRSIVSADIALEELGRLWIP